MRAQPGGLPHRQGAVCVRVRNALAVLSLRGSLCQADRTWSSGFFRIFSSRSGRSLDAICLAESSGGRDLRDGDGGRAIGPYQIHRAYWVDGTRFLGVDWPYSDARDAVKARRVVRAYVTRYQRAGGYPATAESWARTHNGGPRGPAKAATLRYWLKVRGHLGG